MRRVLGLITAPLSAVSAAARGAWGWIDRHHPASWIWPEDGS